MHFRITPNRAPNFNVKWTISCFRDSSKTGWKGVSPGVRFSLRRLHVGEVFPWYTCMPTLGACPHSACGVRRAQAPVMSTTSRLRRHIFAFFCNMRNFRSLFAHPCVMEREFEVGFFAAASCRGQRHVLASSPQKRENQVIVHFTFGGLPTVEPTQPRPRPPRRSGGRRLQSPLRAE